MLKVGVLYGGRSGEHKVSCCSAASVFKNLDKSKYQITAIGIDKKGRWYPQKDAQIILDESFGEILSIKKEGNWLVNHFESEEGLTLYNPDNKEKINVDLVFPVVHGKNCEDGTLQGLLELACVPYVGADVIGSAIGMDKDVAKRLLDHNGISVVPWQTIHRIEWEKNKNEIINKINNTIGLPFFVKPANQGSSVGIFKVKEQNDVIIDINKAFEYDNKLLIEKSIDCREIECSVLGNQEPIVSIPGEIIPAHEFYSYEAKYIDSGGAKFKIPAIISESISEKIQEFALRAYLLLCLKGMARIDFFLEKNSEKIYLNEVNTLPGFTSISMYPKLWDYTGIHYKELLDRLIELALERHRNRIIE